MMEMSGMMGKGMTTEKYRHRLHNKMMQMDKKND
jgi:hypothetical protein